MYSSLLSMLINDLNTTHKFQLYQSEIRLPRSNQSSSSRQIICLGQIPLNITKSLQISCTVSKYPRFCEPRYFPYSPSKSLSTVDARLALVLQAFPGATSKRTLLPRNAWKRPAMFFKCVQDGRDLPVLLPRISPLIPFLCKIAKHI